MVLPSGAGVGWWCKKQHTLGRTFHFFYLLLFSSHTRGTRDQRERSNDDHKQLHVLVLLRSEVRPRRQEDGSRKREIWTLSNLLQSLPDGEWEDPRLVHVRFVGDAKCVTTTTKKHIRNFNWTQSHAGDRREREWVELENERSGAREFVSKKVISPTADAPWPRQGFLGRFRCFFVCACDPIAVFAGIVTISSGLGEKEAGLEFRIDDGCQDEQRWEGERALPHRNARVFSDGIPPWLR